MKIKLLKIPHFETDVNEGKFNVRYPLVPLSLPILKSTLKKNSLKAEQDDLSVKVFRQNIKDNAINLTLFNDEKRVNNFIKTKSDSEKSDSAMESEGLKILNLTKHKCFDLFGFSLDETNNPSTLGVIASLSASIKEKYSVPIICGGRAPNEVVNKLLLSKTIDYWILEGPYANQPQVFVKFCKEFENRNFSPDKIPQLSYNKNGKVKTTNGFLEKDEFVTPDFDGLPLELYKRNKHINLHTGGTAVDDLLVLPYFFVKGCPNRCAFCCNSSWNYYKTNDPDKVSADLKFLSKKYKTKNFYFLNSSINPTKHYINSLVNSFSNNDLSISFTDCATFMNMDEKILRKLKDAGAKRLIYGLETASPKLLNYINKNLKLEHAEKILKKTYELGIVGEVELIPGLPYETEKDVTETISFVQRNQKYIQQINLFKFWIDGRFLKEPAKLGIKLLSEKQERVCIPENKRGFDEIKGLKWKDKVKQTNQAYSRLKKIHLPYRLEEMPNFSLKDYLFIFHITDTMYEK